MFSGAADPAFGGNPLIEIFNIDKANIIAVGEKAQKCLALLFIKEVVHPAARGITTEDFINSMKAVIK